MIEISVQKTRVTISAGQPCIVRMKYPRSFISNTRVTISEGGASRLVRIEGLPMDALQKELVTELPEAKAEAVFAAEIVRQMEKKIFGELLYLTGALNKR